MLHFQIQSANPKYCTYHKISKNIYNSSAIWYDYRYHSKLAESVVLFKSIHNGYNGLLVQVLIDYLSIS